jgi:hypothetical protein
MRTKRKVTAGIMATALVGGLAAGCTRTVVKEVPVKQTPPPATQTPAPTPPPADTQPAPETPAAPATEGPMGTTFTVGPPDVSNSYTIKFDQVAYSVKVGEYDYADVQPGMRLVALHMSATAIDKGADPYPDLELTALGSNGEAYQPEYNSLESLKLFDPGEMKWAGQHADGWVTVQMPKGVTVKSVAWTPSAGMGDTTYTWNVG